MANGKRESFGWSVAVSDREKQVRAAEVAAANEATIKNLQEWMNSRAKGARGERQWRDELRDNGYDARRGQQFCGSPESPDVVCEELSWIHFEVKCVERLNIEDAIEQARRDCRGKVPIVAHKRSYRRWLVTMDAETFFRFLRGEFLQKDTKDANTSPNPLPIAEREGIKTKEFENSRSLDAKKPMSPPAAGGDMRSALVNN